MNRQSPTGRNTPASAVGLDESVRSYYTAKLSQSFVILQTNQTYKVRDDGWSVLYKSVDREFFVSVDHDRAYRVEPGGCLAIPSSRAHRLCSTDSFPAPYKPMDAVRACLSHSGDGVEKALACARADEFFVFRMRAPRENHALLEALPPALLLSKREVETSPHLVSTFEHLQANMDGDDPFNEIINWRYADIVALSILSYALQTNSTPAAEILKSRYDANIRRAVKAIHEDVSRPWTVDTLASAVDLSRASFASRFKVAMGRTPMDYVTLHRMETAKKFLETLNWPIGAIAEEVGYASQPAFINAFKRIVGVSPGEYRKNVRGQ